MKPSRSVGRDMGTWKEKTGRGTVNGRPSHIPTRLHGLCRPRLSLLFVIQLIALQIIIFIAAAACPFLLRMIG